MASDLIMADAAYRPTVLPQGVKILAGYLPSLHIPGPLNAWSGDDWTAARHMLLQAGGGWLNPIYVPGPTEDPKLAARWAVQAAKAVGFTSGSIITLDREQNRDDLTGAWCLNWADEVEAAGCVPLGYTSASTSGLFGTWGYRWIARVGATERFPGDAMTQYAEDVQTAGGTVDLSYVTPGLPLQPVCPPTPPALTPQPPVNLGSKEGQQMRIVSDGTAQWLVSCDLKVKHHLETPEVASQWAEALGQTVVPTDPGLVSGITTVI